MYFLNIKVEGKDRVDELPLTPSARKRTDKASKIEGRYLVINNTAIPIPNLPFVNYQQATYDLMDVSYEHIHFEPSGWIMRIKEGRLLKLIGLQ